MSTEEIRDFTVRLPGRSAAEITAEQNGVDLILTLLDSQGEPSVTVDMPNSTEGTEILSLSRYETTAGTFRFRLQSGYQLPEHEGEVTLHFKIFPTISTAHKARSEAQRLYHLAQESSGAPSRSERLYRSAAQAWGSAGDVLYQAYALYKAAERLESQDLYEDALSTARAAQIPAKASGDLEILLALRTLEGMQLHYLSQYAESRELLKEVIADATESELPKVVAAARFNLARLYREGGQLELSLHSYAEAARYYYEAPDQRPEYRDSLRGQTEVLLDLQRCTDAETVVQSVSASERESTLQEYSLWLAVQGRIELCKARWELQTGRPVPAIFTRALAVSRQRGDRSHYIRTLVQMTKWYDLNGQPLKSLETLQEALRKARPKDSTYPEILTLFGHLHVRNGLVSRGLHFLRRAESQIDSEEALNASLLYALAEAHLRLRELSAATAYVRRAIEHAENLRRDQYGVQMRADFRASKHHYYNLLIELLMRQHALGHHRDPETGTSLDIAAWYAAERFKSRSLVELLLETPSHLQVEIESAGLAKRDQLQARLRRVTQSLSLSQIRSGRKSIDEIQLRELEIEEQQVRSRLDKLESDLRRQKSKLQELKEIPQLDLESVRRQLLDDDTALISYSLGDNGGYAWYVDKTTFRSMAVPSQGELERKIRDLNQAWSDEGSPTEGYLRSLSRQLLGDFADLLTHRRLIISAAGPLQYLPFAALPHPATLSSPPSKQQLLLDRHVIHYIPSVNLLSLLQTKLPSKDPVTKKTTSSPRVLIVADPVHDLTDARVPERLRRLAPVSDAPSAITELLRSMDHPVAFDGQLVRLQRLPNTGKEARSLQKLNPGETMIYEGFAADRDTLETIDLSRFDILHFATHGLYNDRHPHLSGLVLSMIGEDGQQRDGVLYMADIRRWRLNAQLVVLSACETGLGRDVRGEALQGLSQAFLYAGAPRLLVSFWKVDDAATEVLMKSFYSGLWQRGLDPAEALREAQRELRLDGHPPKHWAAFILLGK